MGGKETALLDLMICRIPNLKGAERITLQKKFDRQDEFSSLSKHDIEGIIGRQVKGRSWTMDSVRAAAEEDASIALKRGIRHVSWRSGEYPPLLREIYDPPAVLFYRGSLPNPEKPLVAVVGTRKPSSAASACAYKLALDLGKAGLSVVSGLALGIDAMAHRGGIDSGAATFAVLGSGVDNVYPASNRHVARRLLETGGALMSEYPPQTPPLKGNFPARNRIISALARGTVIVEAPEKSGALITAKFALEQGRDLWVYSVGGTASVCASNGTASSGASNAGAARLAADGAGIIKSARDILAEWNIFAAELKAETQANTGSTGAAGNDLACSLADDLGFELKSSSEEKE